MMMTIVRVDKIQNKHLAPIIQYEPNKKSVGKYWKTVWSGEIGLWKKGSIEIATKSNWKKKCYTFQRKMNEKNDLTKKNLIFFLIIYAIWNEAQTKLRFKKEKSKLWGELASPSLFYLVKYSTNKNFNKRKILKYQIYCIYKVYFGTKFCYFFLNLLNLITFRLV